MKIFNIAFCLIFILFAALQYNDPDPWLWIPLYLYTAVLCGLAARERYYPSAYLIGIIVYGAYAGYKVFDRNGVIDWIQQHNAENIAETMKAAKPWIEESREFFGLVILIAVLIIEYRYAMKRRRIGGIKR